MQENLHFIDMGISFVEAWDRHSPIPYSTHTTWIYPRLELYTLPYLA